MNWKELTTKFSWVSACF